MHHHASKPLWLVLIMKHAQATKHMLEHGQDCVCKYNTPMMTIFIHKTQQTTWSFVVSYQDLPTVMGKLPVLESFFSYPCSSKLPGNTTTECHPHNAIPRKVSSNCAVIYSEILKPAQASSHTTSPHSVPNLGKNRPGMPNSFWI